MKTQTIQPNAETEKYILPLFVSIVITLFLCYIDEGYYNFKWILNLGNWVVFFVYVSVIYLAQLILIVPVFRFAPNFILTVTRFILIILAVLFLGFIVFRWAWGSGQIDLMAKILALEIIQTFLISSLSVKISCFWFAVEYRIKISMNFIAGRSFIVLPLVWTKMKWHPF